MDRTVSTHAVEATISPGHAHASSLEDEGFILLTELRPIVPLHPQHIRKLVKRGEFPAPLKVGGRTVFRRRDIREWARRQGPTIADPAPITQQGA
jgi:predicted DNA-binding transcriptional regulator AlpA